MVFVAALLCACRSEEDPPSPARLSESGLYKDIKSGTLADGVRAYRPQYELWSDGASKKRWLLLPPGTRIDTTDMDGWKFPVGTRVWKEFTRDGVRIETRLLKKIGAGARDWMLVAYVWNREQTDAIATPTGQQNALGTPHDVPDQQACTGCHSGSADTVLGISAIQLDHNLGDLNLAQLASENLLTKAPAGSYRLPGNDNERFVLGYMHGNCGHCHNERAVKPALGLRLYLTVGALSTVQDTPTYKTSINAPTRTPNPLEGTTATKLVVPGDPANSLLHLRMLRRPPDKGRMPNLGSEDVDVAAADAVAAWIRSLPP
jgi:hypothetical protein